MIQSPKPCLRLKHVVNSKYSYFVLYRMPCSPKYLRRPEMWLFYFNEFCIEEKHTAEFWLQVEEATISHEPPDGFRSREQWILCQRGIR